MLNMKKVFAAPGIFLLMMVLAACATNLEEQNDENMDDDSGSAQMDEQADLNSKIEESRSDYQEELTDREDRWTTIQAENTDISEEMKLEVEARFDVLAEKIRGLSAYSEAALEDENDQLDKDLDDLDQLLDEAE